MTKKEFSESLQKFVQQLIGDEKQITTHTALFDDGLIDSLKILDLISFTQTQLGIVIPDEKITIDNFRTITTIVGAFCPN